MSTMNSLPWLKPKCRHSCSGPPGLPGLSRSSSSLCLRQSRLSLCILFSVHRSAFAGQRLALLFGIRIELSPSRTVSQSERATGSRLRYRYRYRHRGQQKRVCCGLLRSGLGWLWKTLLHSMSTSATAELPFLNIMTSQKI